MKKDNTRSEYEANRLIREAATIGWKKPKEKDQGFEEMPFWRFYFWLIIVAASAAILILL